MEEMEQMDATGIQEMAADPQKWVGSALESYEMTWEHKLAFPVIGSVSNTVLVSNMQSCN